MTLMPTCAPGLVGCPRIYIHHPGATRRCSPRDDPASMKRRKSAPCVIARSLPPIHIRPYIVVASGTQEVPDPSRVIDVPTSVIEGIMLEFIVGMLETDGSAHAPTGLTRSPMPAV